MRKRGRTSTLEGEVPESIRMTSWVKGDRRHGQLLSLPGQHPANIRDSTITAVIPEDDESERKSSVQIHEDKPPTLIYPRGLHESPLLSQEGIDSYSPGSLHNPLSPVHPPDFLAAPPTPRYIPPVRGLQKQFSFIQGRAKQSDEELVGLVHATRNEDLEEKESNSPESDESSDWEHPERTTGTRRTGKTGRTYDMV
jgi:hypothetical protein